MATVTSCENALLRKQRENAAASGFPHFSGQSETRLKVSEEESEVFFFISAGLHFGDLGEIDDIRIPRRPWDESLLNMNARLMRGPSLGNKRNMRKITAWGPENQKGIESCKSLEFVSDLQVTGIP